MREAKGRLSALDLIEPPDVWRDAASRQPSTEQEDAILVARPSRRVAAAVVAFAVFGASAILALRAFDGAPEAAGPGDARGAWQALPEGPLSARFDAHAFWVAERVVVVGGRDSRPCPPAADCALPEEPPLRDSAAFAPGTGTWTAIARSPVPVGSASGAVVGDTLYLWVSALDRRPSGRSSFLAYHAEEDRWEELAMPPGAGPTSFLQLVAIDGAVVAYPTSHEVEASPDLLFDPAEGGWRELPPDPVAPSYDRTMVWTGAELLLLALEDVENPGSEGPSLYQAAVLDVAAGTWRRLPDSEISGYDPVWFWSTGRAVNPTIGSSDGGDVNGWGRSYEHGGILDPRTGLWSELPPPPTDLGSYHGPSVGGGGHVVSSQGAILDVAASTWSPLPAPPGAADEGAAVVWAGDRLVVWGGVSWNAPEGTLLDTGWSWRP